MKKKLILAAAGVFSIFTLAACSSGSKDIASMKGATITVDDFYNQVKAESSSQQTVQSMIIYKVFEQKYGDKVTNKEVQAKFDEMKKSVKAQGQDIATQLKQAGYTEKSYKAIIKQSLAYQAGIKSHIKITDKDLKTAWSSFHPEVEAQIIQVASEDDAKAVKKQLTSGTDFAKLAKEKSTDTTTKSDGGKIKFDSQSTTVPTEVQTAAYKLKDGQVSDVLSSTDTSTYQTNYYIVKMIKNKNKGNDMAPYKKELKKIAETTKQNDQTFVQKVTAAELKEANVKIKDDAFKDVLSGLVETSDSSTSKSSSKKTKTSTTKESQTEESSSKTDSSSK